MSSCNASVHVNFLSSGVWKAKFIHLNHLLHVYFTSAMCFRRFGLRCSSGSFRTLTFSSSWFVSDIPVMEKSLDMELLLTSFQKFAVHGDTKASGKELNGKNWAKLCKDCRIIDGKNVTSTDVDIVFSKVKWVSLVVLRLLPDRVRQYVPLRGF